MKYLLLLLLSPSLIFAQQTYPVSPVLSTDYYRLVHNDSLVRLPVTNWHKELRTRRIFNLNTPLRKVVVSGNELKMSAAYPRELRISGDYYAGIAFSTINRLPALQSTYTQGRSLMGAAKWQGPETAEPFSYGPALSQLEYDGSSYPYDINGKLVAAGSGNGHHPAGYTNNIFRTGSLFAQRFSVNTKMLVNGVPLHEFGFLVGHTKENTFIRDNSNQSKSLELSGSTRKKWLLIKGRYNYLQEEFSNTNRSGFLNRVYQQSLLTPVSFDNGQGYTLNAGQRSYQPGADNPGFLLRDNGHRFLSGTHQASLVLERDVWNKMKYKVTQSFENKEANSNESYKPGTAAFPEGMLLERKQRDRQYILTGETSKTFFDNITYVTTNVKAGYTLSDFRTNTSYQSLFPGRYTWQRTTQELHLHATNTYSGFSRTELLLGLGNKSYLSNTAAKSYYFLPDISLAAKYSLPYSNWDLSLKSGYATNATELALNRSLAYVNLLRYSIRDAGKYLQTEEVKSYDHLDPIFQQEWTGTLEVTNGGLWSFSATAFSRNVHHDLFPVDAAGQLVLRNVGNHRSQGIDLSLAISTPYSKDRPVFSQSLSFYTYRNKVTKVNDGYNYTPIAGFSDVHTALIEGRPLGVIVGSTWERDAAGNQIIGADGFPMAAKYPAVIGNPIPDFLVKSNSRLAWKNFLLQADLEWKHGGDRWNGTRAILDYYGRSGQSGEMRNITGYVFTGLQTDGTPNNIPVDFYNTKQDVSKNRWVRYGIGGVAADYVERADWLRLNSLKLSYQLDFRGIIQKITLAAYINNVVLWSPYKGVDPEQLLFDQPNSSGLDFFNLPSTKTVGFNVALQF
ncbi:SusC/RagA family TonB-linked outer membrane protein [Chitinophaga arvensicola]|uniref:TonB-linked outer membrane protein, SusC/RagA family n=1 Tax=Chitinophaga arvensicola TaxID=29529 RepID=A0A1I0S5K7_9BACT|nr:hypothetical protein [Chitinophaga arvensicola]SEW50044.1 hypothetical protein SAMN04488122_3669 [Chitinophaga arvensicola]